ncbi:hypothetical protein [Gemmata sp.]|uniref:hypothetical protein n=1 Tax=Gemmata sp. TaxID=1914242 RepID=UPI003F706114
MSVIEMTALAPARRTHRVPPPVTAGELELIVRMADVMFKGGLTPVSVKRSEGIAALILVGRDVGLSPTQSVANIMIVNGKSTIWGDAVPGLAIASGLLEERKEWYEGTEGEDDYTACCSLKRFGEEPRVTRFSIADAKAANLWGKKGPWQEYYPRQMMWRARSWCYRDTFPDVLCGLIFAEEAMDIPEPSGRVTVSQVQPEPAAIETSAKEKVTSIERPTEYRDDKEHVLGPTDAQRERLMDLRGSLFVEKHATTEEEQDAAWLEALAPYKVTSAKQMTRTQIDELIETLGKRNDPFTHPPAPTTPAT